MRTVTAIGHDSSIRSLHGLYVKEGQHRIFDGRQSLPSVNKIDLTTLAARDGERHQDDARPSAWSIAWLAIMHRPLCRSIRMAIPVLVPVRWRDVAGADQSHNLAS
ncbi:hypothetical protein SB748_26830 [Rhizobium sp. SIMBA_035]